MYVNFINVEKSHAGSFSITANINETRLRVSNSIQGIDRIFGKKLNRYTISLNVNFFLQPAADNDCDSILILPIFALLLLLSETPLKLAIYRAE